MNNKQLYEVGTQRHKYYYVLAKSYDDAKNKVESKILEEHDSNIIAPDGSLANNLDIDVVIVIKDLIGKFII